MSATNDLWRLVARIRHVPLSGADRELLRPVFAAHDERKTIAVPALVESRIRYYAARQPKGA
jgi:hypothetical protein